MKYLSNRDEFLKRSIIKIDEYKTTEDNSSINEEAESGPFANDIPWNDSLLGRLINSTIRKAKVGANLVRIKQVAKRLNGAFEDLLARSAEGQLSKEELAQKNKITIYKFLEALQKSVEDGEKVYAIKNLTDLAIRDFKQFIEVTPADELAVDKTDLEKLVKQLEDFRKFLEPLNDDEGVDFEEEEEEVKEDEDDSPAELEDDSPAKEEEDAEKIKELFYTSTITLLKSVVSLCDVVKTKKISYTSASSTQAKPTEKETNTTTKVTTKEPAKAEEVTTERFFYENESLPIFESQIDPKEVKSINAWKKVEKAYTTSSIGNMVVRIQDLIKNSESGANVELYKKTINKIGYQVVSNEQTIGKNLLSLDALVKEELNPDSENDIPKAISLFGNVILAFKGDMNIATKLVEANQPIKDFITSYDKLKELLPKLKATQTKEVAKPEGSGIKSEDDIELGKRYKYTNKKGEIKDVIAVDKDKVVYPGPDKKYLTSDDKKGKDLAGKEFISVATNKSAGSFAVDPTKLKKESKLFRYFDFINEAEEGQSVEEAPGDETVTTNKGEEVSDPAKKTTSQQVKDYWAKNIDIKNYVMTRTEVERTQIALEKASKNNIVIQGLDPIIEIVKVFNRAYKLHTTQVIPTGRSGGRVSNKTFREYTTFGDGSPDSAGFRGGPYRNNVIFDQWENAVQEIKKQTRFQKVFRQETTLKTEQGNIIKDAGKNLLKFMNDMLDGDTLYKTGKDGKGKQADFIEKYFGATDAEKLPLYVSEKDKEEVPKTANSMPKDKNLSFKKEDLKFEKYSELVGTFFYIQIDGKKQFFYIQEVDSEYAYVTYCKSWFFFKNYIAKSAISLKASLDVKDDEKDGGKQYIIKATRIKLTDLIKNDGQFVLNGDYKVKYLTKYSDDKNNAGTPSALSADDKDDKFIIGSEKFTLCEVVKDANDKDVTKRFQLSNKNIGEVIRSVGGFPAVKIDGINKTYFTK